jgi:hypothetical protein
MLATIVCKQQYVKVESIGALPGMIVFFVIIFDKFGSLRAKIEPVVNELRRIDSLFRLGTSRYHFK